MGVIIPQVVTTDRATGGQVINGSVGFTSESLARLTRTPSSAGNRRTFTWSGWVKRYYEDTHGTLLARTTDVNDRHVLALYQGQLYFFGVAGGTTTLNVNAGEFRDPTSWYHLVFSFDTTQGNANDRTKFYVNGVELGSDTVTYTTQPTQNQEFNINTAAEHTIGHESEGAGALPQELNGRLSQVYFIDGQALDASYFGFTDPLTNTWKPKKYVNTTASHGDAAGVVGFGTNGFYLPLDGSAPIGQDQSGQGNDWTPVNFGGSVALDNPNVSGARPILNTTQGGTQAEVGVFGSKQNVGYAVTVYDDGGGNKYYIDGVKQATLTGLIRGATYTFDQTDSTNNTHPLVFGTTANGNDFSNGVSITGSPGSTGITSITIPYNAPNTLYYHCSAHANMGDSITGITTNEKLADQYASNCTLALPLVGSIGDVSGSISCTTSSKAITNNGSSSATSASSNFYGGSWDLERGSSQYLSWSSTETAPDTGDFTYEVWFNTESNNNYMALFDARDEAVDSKGFFWGIDSNGQYYLYYTGSVRITAGNVISTGRWYHGAVTRESGILKMWLDGVLIGTYDTSNSNMSTDVTRLGSDVHGQSYYFDGKLQDARIYIGVAKYTSNFIPASTSPDILPDTPSGVSGSSKLTKITEGAVDFDGEGFVVTSASSDFDFGSGDFTVEAYVRPTNATQTDPSVVSLWNFPDSRRSWGIFGNSGGVSAVYNGSIRGAVSPDGEFATRTEITGTLRLDSWNHVAFVRNGNTLNFFIDGVSQGTASYTGSVYTNTTDGVMVGAMGDASDARNNINARISNVRVIKGTALYTKNFVPPSAPLTNVTNTKLLTCQENQFKILTDTTDATGGNSIQNTNNSGITSTTGNRTDSNSSSLVLAVPFNGTTDDICDEVGSATAKAATLINSPSSENIGHFYGKSYKFTGADGQRINYAASADFNFGTGAFTVEGWYYHLEKTSSNVARRYFVHNETAWESSRWIIYCGYTGYPDRALFYTYDTYNSNGNLPHLIGKTIFTVGNWYHIAVTRSSNTFRLFVNGRLEDQDDDSNSVGNSTIPLEVGGASVQTDRTLFGHIQDLRIYKGVAKYTAPFVPPRVPTYDSAVTPSSNIVGLAGGESLQTNFNPFITDISTVRGQETGYATLNNLIPGACTLSDGNLTATAPSGTTHGAARSTLSMDTSGAGKFYFEATLNLIGGTYAHIGVLDTVKTSDANYVGNTTNCFSYRHDGKKQLEGATALSYGDSFTTGDTIGCSFDCGSGELRFYKNGVDQGVAKTITADYHACFAVSNFGSSGQWKVNFGQKPFKFPPPDGHQPLNIANVRLETVISRPDQFVGITTWSGDNVDGREIDMGMTPDLIWVKTRNQTNWHWLTDTVRGAPNKIYSNSGNAEDTTPQYGQADSFTYKGWIAGGGTDGSNPLSDSNKTGTDYVCWAWKAGGNKNTFNVDNVGYSTSTDIGFNAGGQNSNAYDTSAIWSGMMSGTSNSGVYTNLFDGTDGDAGGYEQPTNGNTLTFTPTGGITANTSIEIYVYQSTDTYSSSADITVNGTSIKTGAVQSALGTGSAGGYVNIGTKSLATLTWSNPGGSNNDYRLMAIRVDGKMLVDSNQTPPNLPSIAPTGCSVGTKQGFSIMRYQANNTAGATIPHGLSKIPNFVVVKSLEIAGSSNSDWTVFHSSNGGRKTVYLNEADAAGTTGSWNNTSPGAAGITLGTAHVSNLSPNHYIAYIWHDVPGLQKFGSFEGNDADGSGPFVELGFRPAVILLKNADASQEWILIDGTRDPVNPSYKWVEPSDNVVENSTSTNNSIDILSNGFTPRGASSTNDATNGPSQTIIYAAWAEAPSIDLFGGGANAR